MRPRHRGFPAAARTLEGGREDGRRAVRLPRPSACAATSKQPSFLYSCHFKQSPPKPPPRHPKNDRPPAPRFISGFEVPCCWDRAEPRKRGPNWMLILVPVPEMSGAIVISAVPLYLLSGIITFSKQRMEGPHRKPPAPQTDSRNFLS